jgi:hypothetical protein
MSWSGPSGVSQQRLGPDVQQLMELSESISTKCGLASVWRASPNYSTSNFTPAALLGPIQCAE